MCVCAGVFTSAMLELHLLFVRVLFGFNISTVPEERMHSWVMILYIDLHTQYRYVFSTTHIPVQFYITHMESHIPLSVYVQFHTCVWYMKSKMWVCLHHRFLCGGRSMHKAPLSFFLTPPALNSRLQYYNASHTHTNTHLCALFPPLCAHMHTPRSAGQFNDQDKLLTNWSTQFCRPAVRKYLTHSVLQTSEGGCCVCVFVRCLTCLYQCIFSPLCWASASNCG